jgi:dihydrofolate reductase
VYVRDIIYYVAASLDGFIAREDGSFDAFPFDAGYFAHLVEEFPETFPAPYREQMGNTAENRHFDAVLMGRSTYEVGLRGGLTSPYPSLDQYVVSTSMRESPDPAVTLISAAVESRIGELRAQPGRAIWLCGGGTLASTLLAAGLLTGLIIKLNPVVLGTGIPLFSGALDPARLTLTHHRALPSGHVLLHYRVD